MACATGCLLLTARHHVHVLAVAGRLLKSIQHRRCLPQHIRCRCITGLSVIEVDLTQSSDETVAHKKVLHYFGPQLPCFLVDFYNSARSIKTGMNSRWRIYKIYNFAPTVSPHYLLKLKPYEQPI